MVISSNTKEEEKILDDVYRHPCATCLLKGLSSQAQTRKKLKKEKKRNYGYKLEDLVR